MSVTVEKIKKHISENDTGKALSCLFELKENIEFEDKHFNEVIMLNRQYEDFLRKKRLGLIDDKDTSLDSTVLGLLNLVDELDKRYDLDNSISKESTKSMNKKIPFHKSKTFLFFEIVITGGTLILSFHFGVSFLWAAILIVTLIIIYVSSPD